MTVPVNRILSTAATLLNDEEMVTWPQVELLNWLNAGQIALAKRPGSDAKVKTVAVQLVPGAKQTNPADCIEIIEIRQNNGGGSVTACERSMLDRFSPNWMKTPTASTVKHYMDDPQPDTFYVYPAQGAAPATVVMTYTATPAMVGIGNNIDVRDIYEDNLVNYILYRAFSKDSEASDVAKASAYYQLFKE